MTSNGGCKDTKSTNLTRVFGTTSVTLLDLHALMPDCLVQSNIRFESGKEAVLASLPPTASALDRENALSEFYKQWVMQETDRTNAYTLEWRARNLSCITEAARAMLSKFGKKLTFQ